MKILYVTTISNTINAFLVPHIKWLIEEGHTVDLAFNQVNMVNSELLELGCKTHQIDFQRSPLSGLNIKAYRDIEKLLKNEDYDLVHVHTPVASFLTRVACRNKKNTKVMYTAHGFHFFKGAPLKNHILFKSIEKMVAKNTDAIITMNKEDYDFAKSLRLRKEKSVYKTHGVGIDLGKYRSINDESKKKLRMKYGYSNNDFILFYAAELNSNKNQKFLIDVVNYLSSDIPNIRLLLAGKGPLEDKYKEAIKKMNLQNKVELLGYRTDIANLLSISDIAVASSQREGLPVNIMEAMASGLPIVATKIRGHNDLVKDKENGFLIAENDIIEFSNAIKMLYLDKDLRSSFQMKSTLLVENYNIHNVLKELKNIYIDFLGN